MNNEEWLHKFEKWLDENPLPDIDDRYLLNILNFISKGGGYTELMTEKNIELLFNEANKRKLKHKHALKQLKEAFREKLYYECQVAEHWCDYID